MGKGDGVRRPGPAPEVTRERIGKDALSTMAKASALTGISKARLKSDDVANVCGGAAVLAQYQREAGGARDLGDWSAVGRPLQRRRRPGHGAAVRHRGLPGHPAGRGPHHQRRPAHGAARRTPARASTSQAVRGSVSRSWVTAMADCPAKLGCEWFPAPYEQYGPDAGDYGNHDLADRPTRPRHRLHRHPRHRGDLRHHARAGAGPDVRLVALHAPVRRRPHRPARRPDDSRLARRQLVRQHALDRPRARGLRGRRGRVVHRGDVPHSAQLVRLPRRRSTTSRSTARTSSATTRCRASCPATSPGMHWDPGPYWDWEHYMRLLGAPINGDPKRPRQHGRHRAARLRRQRAAGHRLRPDRGRAVRGRRLRTSSTCTASPTPTRRWCPTSACTPDGESIDDVPVATSARGPRPASSSWSRRSSGTGPQVWWLGDAGWIDNPGSDRSLVAGQRARSSPRRRRTAGCRSTAVPTRSRRPTRPDPVPDGRAAAVHDQARPAVRARRRRRPDRLLLREDVQLLGARRLHRRASATDQLLPDLVRPPDRLRRAADVTIQNGVATAGLARRHECHGHRAQQQTGCLCAMDVLAEHARREQRP